MTKRAFDLIGASVLWYIDHHSMRLDGAGALVLEDMPARVARSRAPGEPYL